MTTIFENIIVQHDVKSVWKYFLIEIPTHEAPSFEAFNEPILGRKIHEKL